MRWGRRNDGIRNIKTGGKGNEKDSINSHRSDAGAFHGLGLCCVQGLGVAKDARAAMTLFRKGAELGDTNCVLALEAFKNEFEAEMPDLTPLIERAKEEDAEAQYLLGMHYIQGLGVPQNFKEAAKWFRKAAKLGNADAMYCLGMCYGRGEGLKENFVEAERWLKKAAMQGHQQAREMLFKMWGA